uniref:Chitin-binding type-2 domain-containing protein n=1 Tax=Phlebotomus papatasi TaxID=29031 RepID=A0A1B0DBV8_PHLPP
LDDAGEVVDDDCVVVELGGADVVLSDGAEELLDIVELEGGADDEDGGAVVVVDSVAEDELDEELLGEAVVVVVVVVVVVEDCVELDSVDEQQLLPLQHLHRRLHQQHLLLHHLHKHHHQQLHSLPQVRQVPPKLLNLQLSNRQDQVQRLNHHQVTDNAVKRDSFHTRVIVRNSIGASMMEMEDSHGMNSIVEREQSGILRQLVATTHQRVLHHAEQDHPLADLPHHPVEKSTTTTTTTTTPKPSPTSDPEPEPEPEPDAEPAPSTEDKEGLCQGEGFVAHPTDCRKFYRCVSNENGGYNRYEFECGEGTAWDDSIQGCNHEHLVERCGGKATTAVMGDDHESAEIVQVLDQNRQVVHQAQVPKIAHRPRIPKAVVPLQLVQNLAHQLQALIKALANHLQVPGLKIKPVVKHQIQVHHPVKRTTIRHLAVKVVLPQITLRLAVLQHLALRVVLRLLLLVPKVVLLVPKAVLLPLHLVPRVVLLLLVLALRVVLRHLVQNLQVLLQRTVDKAVSLVQDQDLKLQVQDLGDNVKEMDSWVILRIVIRNVELEATQVQNQEENHQHQVHHHLVQLHHHLVLLHHQNLHHLNPLSRKSFNCESEGFHPDPDDCAVFHRCVDDGNGGYTKYTFKCGPGSVFSSTHNVCVHPSESDNERCGLASNSVEPESENQQQQQPAPSSTTTQASTAPSTTL